MDKPTHALGSSETVPFTNHRDLLENQVRLQGDKPLTYFYEKSLTYSEFDNLANRVANAFGERGIKKGDKVAVMLTNSDLNLAVFYGLAKLGAICVPVHGALKGEILRYEIDHCDCVAAIVHESVMENFRQVQKQLLKLHLKVASNSDRTDYLSLEKMVAGASSSQPPAIEIKPGDPFMITHTSGTTGLPKACILSHYSTLSSTEYINRFLKPTPDDVIYVCLPMYYINPHTAFWSALMSGASLAISERFSVSNFWKEVCKYDATIIWQHFVPEQMLLKQPFQEEEKKHRVHSWVVVTGPLAIELRKRFGVPRHIALYGSQEGGPWDAVKLLAEEDTDDVCGKARDDVEIEIHNEDDFSVPVGTIGQIVYRGRRPHAIFDGYYNDCERTLQAFSNFWFHSGDLGFLDANDELHFFQRQAESVRRRGEFVPIDYVESIIRKHPKVSDVAIVGVPSELGEEEVKAYVISNAEKGLLMPEDVYKYCQDNLPRFMIPRFIEFIDSLPRTEGSDKVQRSRLKQLGVGKAWDAQEKMSSTHRA